VSKRITLAISTQTCSTERHWWKSLSKREDHRYQIQNGYGAFITGG
jgi:hypothetical protein